MGGMTMRKCKACGGAFASTNTTDEICYPCENALKRLNGYAIPVVRCKECQYCLLNTSNGSYYCKRRGYFSEEVKEDDYCSYGEKVE